MGKLLALFTEVEDLHIPGPGNATPGCMPKTDVCTCASEEMNKNVQSSIICINPKLQIIQKSIHRNRDTNWDELT